MNKTKTKQIDMRQKIVAAALSLFRTTHHISKVSIEDIAHEAGVSPTTIYNNYGNRDQLVYEVIKILMKDNIEHNRELIHSELPFPQKLTLITSGKIDMASKLNGEIIEKIVSQDKTIAPFIDEIYETEIKPLWLEMLADGKKQGYIDPSLDDQALLIYLDALKAGFAAKKETMRNIINNPDFIKQLTHIAFFGFLKKDINLFEKGGQ